MGTDRLALAPNGAQPAADGEHRRRTIALAVCTFRRNDELRRLLDSAAAAATRAHPVADVGVVVVDDNPDGQARAVAEAFDGRFAGGVTYVHSGQCNIARARNLGLATAVPLADWVAMTDDDVVVPEDWFCQLVAVQERTGSLAVTGPMVSRFPADSPSWLVDEPFPTMGVLEGVDDAPADTCATHNSMVSSAWLADHPEIRFADDLGVLGGEDMVFYRRAIAAGLTASYSSHTVVHQHEPAERATLAYQLRRALWIGNSEYVTNRRMAAASRPRLALRGGRRVLRAAADGANRLRRGDELQWRFTAARMATGLGLVLGALGVELRHR